METLHKQQIHSEEVQDILLNTPRWLSYYSILATVLFMAILIIIYFSFQYQETSKINISIRAADSTSRAVVINNEHFDSAFIGAANLSQATYGKLADTTVVLIQFPIYPSEKFGTIRGTILKSQFDKIDNSGFIKTIIAIQRTSGTSPVGKIEFRPGMQGEGTITYSSKSMLSRILE